MKKLSIFITFLVVLSVAGYLYYDKVLKKAPVSVWDLVPYETVLVYEASACNTCIEEVKKSPLTTIIERAAFPATGDSLAGLRNFIFSFQKPALASLHTTKRDDFDFVFYIPFDQNLQRKFFLYLEELKKIKGVRNAERDYNGIRINEISFNKQVFSWIVIDNNWIGTYTPVLIEDVIRTFTTSARNFKSTLAPVYQLPKIRNDAGNLYVNLSNFSQWLSSLVNEKPDYRVEHFGRSALLDLKLSGNDKVILNGFSVNHAGSADFVLSAFEDQTPVPFELKQFIPNNTLMFTSYGISHGKEFYNALRKFRLATPDSLSMLERSLHVDFSTLFNNFSGEAGVATVETKDGTTAKVLLLHNDTGIANWLKVFGTLSQKLSVDTVFYEKYASYEIKAVPVYRFPEKLFGQLVTGFDHCYYTSFGNVIGISDDPEILKKVLHDIDREDTWGKSVNQNKFLEATLLESNISLFVNTSKVWNVLSASLHPKWRKFVSDNQSVLNTLGMGSIQFSHLNDSYYTNITWSVKSADSKENTKPENRFIVNFENGISTMAVSKSHVDRADEVLIQDSTRNISLFSNTGKLLWSVPLGDFMVSDIFQLDYFKNGKLQYLFATPGQLHIIDRLGNYVKSYPVAVPEKAIEFLSVVDYDHSKNYRFLIAGSEGRLWMFDKEGNNLEGWTPRQVNSTLSTAARHHRILGRDYLIAIGEDGMVYLMNRRGEMLPHFPLDLKTRLDGDYALERGKSVSNTYFTVVSKEGIRIKFNLQGKVLSREVLVKNSLDARFSLVAEKDLNAYLIIRQEAKQLTVFDEKLTPVIVSDFIANNPVTVQFRQFGGGRNFIILTDQSQDLSFIYNSKGVLLTPIPLDSDAIQIILDGNDRLKVYNSFVRSLSIGYLP